MKKAFSMIELIFAIVLVGIAATAVPTIVSQTGESNARSLTMGELLTHARTSVLSVLDAPWEVTDSYDGLHIIYGVENTTTKKIVCDRLQKYEKAVCDEFESKITGYKFAKKIEPKYGDFNKYEPVDISSFNGLKQEIIAGTNGDDMILQGANIETKVSYVDDGLKNIDPNSKELIVDLDDETQSSLTKKTYIKLITVKSTSRDDAQDSVWIRGYAINSDAAKGIRGISGASWEK